MAVLAAIGATITLALPSTHTGDKKWHLGIYDPGIPAHNVENATYYAFCHKYVRCGYGREAWNVSGCESGHSIWAKNGQYLGLFQVSSQWRRVIPGFAMNPWAQARHAFKVFTRTGWAWGPWSCAWAAGG